jgi:UDP-N-acetylmuramoyl-tripeptide--D-alanyl-D-alanine ligase
MKLLEALVRSGNRPRQVARWLLKIVAFPLARAWRRQLRRTAVIAVTGTAGKTTCKRLLVHILERHGPVVATRGTGNRGWMLLRVVARLRPRHRAGVFETAAWGPDTLDEALWLLEPRIGVVTLVDKEHLSAFRTAEAVAREKVKLPAALPDGGLAVLNADDPRVRAMATATRARVVLVGRASDADLRAEEVTAGWPDTLRFTLVLPSGRRLPVKTRLYGEHWLPSVLSALAVALELGVPADDAAAALAAAEPEPHRLSERRTAGGVTFLEDDWNGSEYGFATAFEVLRTARARRRILVLGKVSDTRASHRVLYRRMVEAANTCADIAVFVDAAAHHARRVETRIPVHPFTTALEAQHFLAGILEAGDLVLVKSTCYGAHLERLALAFTDGVLCWRHACGRRHFCEDCRMRWVPERGAAAGATAAAPEGGP